MLNEHDISILQKLNQSLFQSLVLKRKARTPLYPKVLIGSLQQVQQVIMKTVTKQQQASPKTDNYSVRVLRPENAKQALELLAREFQAHQPLSIAYYKLSPLQKDARVQGWTKFWKFFEEDYLTNGISAGCFDMNNGGELVGVCVNKDFTYIPEGLEEFLMENNFINPILRLEERMMASLSLKHQSILLQAQKGEVLDFWGVAVKAEHNGKGLLRKMSEFLLKIGVQKKFQYCFAFITNYKSGQACLRRHATRIAHIDSKESEVDERKPFEKVEQLHRYSALYFRTILVEKPSL